MASNQGRRSPRLALQVPIRIYGTDFKGKDFVEDSTTLVVGFHGAKIQVSRQLLAEQEVRILCYPTSQEGVFRVVAPGENSVAPTSFWGVESLAPRNAFWGIVFPPPQPDDQTSVHVMIQCPECRTRELLHVKEKVLESMQGSGGPVRTCEVCGKSAQWKQVDYWDA